MDEGPEVLNLDRAGEKSPRLVLIDLKATPGKTSATRSAPNLLITESAAAMMNASKPVQGRR